MQFFIDRVPLKYPPPSRNIRDKSYRRWSLKVCPEAKVLGLWDGLLLIAKPNIAHTSKDETQVLKFVTMREYGTMDLKGLEFIGYYKGGTSDWYLFREVD